MEKYANKRKEMDERGKWKEGKVEEDGEGALYAQQTGVYTKFQTRTPSSIWDLK